MASYRAIRISGVTAAFDAADAATALATAKAALRSSGDQMKRPDDTLVVLAAADWDAATKGDLNP